MFRMSLANKSTHIHILSQHMCRIGGNGPNVRAVTIKSLASSTLKVAKHRRITFETKTLPDRVERYHPVAELQDLHHRFPCQILMEFLSLGPKTFSAIPHHISHLYHGPFVSTYINISTTYLWHFICRKSLQKDLRHRRIVGVRSCVQSCTFQRSTSESINSEIQKVAMSLQISSPHMPHFILYL